MLTRVLKIDLFLSYVIITWVFQWKKYIKFDRSCTSNTDCLTLVQDLSQKSFDAFEKKNPYGYIPYHKNVEVSTFQ